jgi:hypothetical protein
VPLSELPKRYLRTHRRHAAHQQAVSARGVKTHTHATRTRRRTRSEERHVQKLQLGEAGQLGGDRAAQRVGIKVPAYTAATPRISKVAVSARGE